MLHHKQFLDFPTHEPPPYLILKDLHLTDKQIPGQRRGKKHTGKQRKKKGKTTWADKTLPTSSKEIEIHWLKRADSPLHHKAGEQRIVVVTWRVSESKASKPGCEKYSCLKWP
eukprot:1158954-Pelagomonas_calceolata.AAC.5